MRALNILNRLLPFATPGTPFIQDLLHLVALCVLLYFAPQIQQTLQTVRDDGTNVDVAAPTGEDDNELAGGVPLGQDDTEVIQDENLPPNHAAEEEQPGPARLVNIPPQRNVGAKKAKALARRDQRRAYNEFVRSQGDAQRARDAEGAAEREAALAAEKERRRTTEAALEAKKAKQREVRRQREERERREEMQRREFAIELIREGLEAQKMLNLFDVARQIGNDVDGVWVEQILQVSGLLGRKGNELVMLTSTGWVVRVTADDMARMYAAAVEQKMGHKDGRVEFEDLGAILETLLRD